MDPENDTPYTALHDPETHANHSPSNHTTSNTGDREEASAGLSRGPTAEPDSYPEDMAARDQWVVWKPTETGGKVPRSPWNNPGSPNRYTDPTDPGHWVSYSEASEWVAANREYGLGFVLSERDPFALIDFDKARDPDTGGLHPTAREVPLRAGSYADVSVSGTGLHVMVRGRLPAEMGRLTKTPLPEQPDFPKASIEVYDAGQFVAMSGEHLQVTPRETTDCQPLLEELVEEYAPAPVEETSSQRALSGAPIDPDIESRLRGAMHCDSTLRALYEGQYTEAGFPGDRSKAECSMAERLGYWFWRDAELVEQLIEHSMTETSTTSRGDPRKWNEEGEGYRESILKYAEANPGRYYDGELSRVRALVSGRVMEGLLQGLLKLQEASTKELTEYLREEHDLERSTRQVLRGLDLFEKGGLISHRRKGRSTLWVFGD